MPSVASGPPKPKSAGGAPLDGPVPPPLPPSARRDQADLPLPPPIRHSTGPAGYPPLADDPFPPQSEPPRAVQPGSAQPGQGQPVRPGIGNTPPLGIEATSRSGLADTLDSIHRFDADRAVSLSPGPVRTGPNWTTISAVVAVLLAIVGGFAFLSRFRSDDSSDGSASSDALIANPSVNQLAQATVQIVGLDNDGGAMCSGSGTLVSTEGMILTNAHVVLRDTLCDFTSLGIAVTDDAGRPPSLLYRADLLAVNNEIDLAVLQIARTIDPDTELPPTFPALGLGDSDELTIGDDLRIFGYPEIGGETITFTNGSVSGFTAQANVGDRALIKTDATIAGGNSGGAAVNAQGQLIGIPTKARASESGPAVDCRPLADTNGDGQVDSNDNCVPIGGFLNGIRPVNLARDLLDEAADATPRGFEPAAPDVVVDIDLVRMSRPRFSLGESGNAPSQVVLTAEGGVNELCLFVDWSGIPQGAEWDGLWYYNEELVDDFSLAKQTWTFGEQGNNFWMCAIDDKDGLEAGLYELGFFLEGQLVFAEGIVLTEETTSVYATVWENTTDIDICGLAINPKGSGPVGLNELSPGVVIAPSETITIDLPEGEAVVEAYDCSGEAIADSGGVALEIVEGHIYTIDAPEGSAE